MAAPSAQLDLVRFAIATFTPSPGIWTQWSANGDGVSVYVARAWEEDSHLRLLLAAVNSLKYRPKVSQENLVYVPEGPRKDAESALERAANLLAATQGCRRHLSSPWPPVMLAPTGQIAEEWLAERDGLEFGRLRNRASFEEGPKLSEMEMNQLGDRPDGLALLAEANQHRHSSGQFHEYVRVFERAFGKSSSALIAPLTACLHPRFGYSESEVKHWIKDLRDPLTHADQRPGFLLERDVNPVIDRVQQAARDVIFNKADWRSIDSQRRELWAPPAGLTGSRGTVFVIKGEKPPLLGAMLDQYGAYPMNLKGVVKPIPPGLWPKQLPASSKTERFKLEVIEPGAIPAAAGETQFEERT